MASTKIYLLDLKDRGLAISSIGHIQTKAEAKALITNILQGRNNKTKKKTLPLSTSSFFSTLFSKSQKHLHNAFKVIDPPFHSSVDSCPAFGGNFAPVEELEPTDCEVIMGELPLTFNGVYIRNGPNDAQNQPGHLLDLFFGDGMLHSLQLSNGHARYCSRYVKTYKYMIERDAGSPLFPSASSLYKIVDLLRFLMAILTGHLDPMKGSGVANTSLAFFANKLVALCEYDLPYAINLTENGDIETLGRWEFDGKPKLLANMTAHPKVDSETKETFAFRWSLIFPHLTFFRFDENGIKQKEVPIFSIKQPSFFHDFAITKRFAIFHETQLVVSPMKVMMGRGKLVDYQPGKTPRIGVIPRNSLNDSEMKWFEIQGFNTIHILNAWENGDDEIVVLAPNIASFYNAFDENVEIKLEKVTINMKTKNVSRNILSPRNLDFGSINPCYVGKETRFTYLGVNTEASMKMSGVVKIDLKMGGEVGRRFYGLGCFGGEPLFVRRNPEDTMSDEDDGYLVSYVHNEQTNESKFLVMDAQSPELDIVAMVKLPRRVPYGFHGLFLAKDQIPNYSIFPVNELKCNT
ncbi:zeaxanthin 7,8(7',8')-cleavage dioxygenase, chromoplastic-like [Durio zibethinus]|uniref:Zeaxanthin 7,8(7',8')-cleavage dioxygenase, chromoplastic-like n=1 Tax=Durio zibethinus TaxID=66656 RepID=A0A6P5XJZ4_DURZI|nr:zeaxanthin 7,8(7',8')-cleavage dioxygenase, chromoplastic-like [Durio zibethinus]